MVVRREGLVVSGCGLQVTGSGLRVSSCSPGSGLSVLVVGGFRCMLLQYAVF